MNLNSDKVLLRPYEPQHDYLDMYRWYYSGDYERYFRYSALLLKQDDFKNLEYLLKNVILMVFKVGDDGIPNQTPIGAWEYFDHIPGEQAKIGVIIDEEHQRGGYALLSGWVFLNYMFNTLKVNRIYGDIMKSDSRLAFLLKKFGAKEMGCGDFPNELRFELTKGQYEEALCTNQSLT